MTKPIRLPKMSLSMEEGRIARWLVGKGQQVEKDQAIVEVETDKSVVELPVPENGVIENLLVQEGDVVLVGQPIAILQEGNGQQGTAESPQMPERVAPTRIAASPSARRRARELGVDLAKVQGSGPAGRIIHLDIERTAGELPLPPMAACHPAQSYALIRHGQPAAEFVADHTLPLTGKRRPLTGMRRTIAR
jgi:pyruvate dehydrogenase E2 component (dihydrolipoamide acetyltransferase)